MREEGGGKNRREPRLKIRLDYHPKRLLFSKHSNSVTMSMRRCERTEIVGGEKKKKNQSYRTSEVGRG